MLNTCKDDTVRRTSGTNIARHCFGVILLAASGFHGLAQVPEASAAQPQSKQRPARKSNLDVSVSRLTKTLDLSPDQQSAVKNILEQRMQQTLQIRRDPSISGSARIDRFRMLQETTVQRIRAVLNDEQKKKYDPMAASHNQKAPERSVEDWLKASAPK